MQKESVRRHIVANKKVSKAHTHPKNDSKGTARLRALYKNAQKGNLPM
ncbi:MAG TPA: hypothetical protein VK808_05255 [Bacteroidia bacterium]|jgi:hypothetical protein|nr:hypothetical protein [Bacteroidia bacterium]